MTWEYAFPCKINQSSITASDPDYVLANRKTYGLIVPLNHRPSISICVPAEAVNARYPPKDRDTMITRAELLIDLILPRLESRAVGTT